MDSPTDLGEPTTGIGTSFRDYLDSMWGAARRTLEDAGARLAAGEDLREAAVANDLQGDRAGGGDGNAGSAETAVDPSDAAGGSAGTEQGPSQADRNPAAAIGVALLFLVHYQHGWGEVSGS